MSRTNAAIGLVTLGMLAVSCAPITVNRTWTDPTARIGTYRSLMVFCSCQDTIASRILEDAVVHDLSLRGVQARPAYQIVSADSLSETELRRSLLAKGVDGIIVVKMTGVENRASYVPGVTYTVPETHYSSLYERFITGYRRVHEPGYFDHYQVLDMQADLYDQSSGKLVTTVSTSQTKSDVNTDMRDFAKALVSRLAHVRLLG